MARNNFGPEVSYTTKGYEGKLIKDDDIVIYQTVSRKLNQPHIATYIEAIEKCSNYVKNTKESAAYSLYGPFDSVDHAQGMIDELGMNLPYAWRIYWEAVPELPEFHILYSDYSIESVINPDKTPIAIQVASGEHFKDGKARWMSLVNMSRTNPNGSTEIGNNRQNNSAAGIRWGYSGNINNEVGLIDFYDQQNGYELTDNILKLQTKEFSNDYEEGNYPAAYLCRKFKPFEGKGYLPSLYELTWIARNLDAINKVLAEIPGAIKIGDSETSDELGWWLWSSSEYSSGNSWYLYTYICGVLNYYRIDSYGSSRVRAFLAY